MPDPKYLILPEVGLHVEMDQEETSDEGSPGWLRVLAVAGDTPARRATFEQGDVILSVNEEPVRSLDQFRDLVEGSQAAPELNVVVERNGERKTLLLIVKRGPSDTSPATTGEATRGSVEDH